MDTAIALDTELGNAVEAASSMADVSHDATKLPRAMVAGGVGEAAAALYLALFKSPAAGLFRRTNHMLYSYYAVLAAVVLFGVAQAWAGLWVSREPQRRRAVGTTVLWVSVLPLLFLASVGGHAILN